MCWRPIRFMRKSPITNVCKARTQRFRSATGWSWLDTKRSGSYHHPVLKRSHDHYEN